MDFIFHLFPVEIRCIPLRWHRDSGLDRGSDDPGGFDSRHTLCLPSYGKDVKDVFGRADATVGVDSLLKRSIAAHGVECLVAGRNFEGGRLSGHYVAEISLNVTLNHIQPTQCDACFKKAISCLTKMKRNISYSFFCDLQFQVFSCQILSRGIMPCFEQISSENCNCPNPYCGIRSMTLLAYIYFISCGFILEFCYCLVYSFDCSGHMLFRMMLS